MTGSGTIPGVVYGRAGGSLAGAGWAQKDAARIGASGERLTAEVLDPLAKRPGGVTVLHDLDIPIPGFKANIDHVIVAGSTVTIIDSKVWRPGIYRTRDGVTKRGFRVAEFADKKTLQAACDGFRRHLVRHELADVTVRAVLVAWSTHPVWPVLFAGYEPAGAVAAAGWRFRLSPARWVGSGTADSRIVTALLPLVRK
ncbi:MAG: nuclease-related domain-containing protein [Microbacterium gubbeenense]